MDDGKHCPACGKDIGVWPIFSAALPNRIWCPHCSARLRYRGSTGLMLVVIVLAIGLGAGALFVSWKYARMSLPLWLAVLAGLVIVPWVIVELGVAAFLRSRRILERAGARTERKVDDIA